MANCKSYLSVFRESWLIFFGTFFFINILFPQLTYATGFIGNSKKAELAWVKKNGENFDIGYTFFDGNQWKGQLMLSTGNPVNFVPAMSKQKNGGTWIAWSSDTGKQYHLYYAVISDDNKITGPHQIRTQLSSNATPSIIIDHSDTPWMVWSGNNGDDDDIYFSKYINNNWQQPELVHIDNETPDISPKLILESDGAVVVEWTNLNKIKSQQQKAYLQQGIKGKTVLKADLQSSTTIKDQIFQCVPGLPDIENIELSTLQLNCDEDGLVIQFVGKTLKKE